MESKNRNEEIFIEAYLNGDDEILESLEEDDIDDIDIVELHDAEKSVTVKRRKADRRAKKAIQNKPVTLYNEIFRHATAKEKKLKKRATSKKCRRSGEMVNSQRALSHKIYKDIYDIKATKSSC